LQPFVRALFAAFLIALPSFAAHAELLSAHDREAYAAAFRAAGADKWEDAWREAAQAKEKLPQKVLRWMELSRGGSAASFADITAFIEANPNWPGLVLLRQRAEEAMAGVPDDTMRAWFAKYRPVTPLGKLRQADLLAASGKQDAARTAIREAWINGDFSSADEKVLLAKYRHVIRRKDQIERLDRLVWDGDEDAAKRQMRRVPADWRALAEARLRLARLGSGVDRLIDRVPKRLQRDPGLLYERLRWRRRKEHFQDALEILLHPPKELGRPAAWWAERQILARRALADKKPKIAYRLVEHPGLTDGVDHAEAEFLAGWIALELLHDHKGAYAHFVRLYESVKRPISLARGAYWAGRAAEAARNKKEAARWYAAAAEYTATYYGQLAAAKLGDGAPRPTLAPEPTPSAAARAAFGRRELVRAARMLSEIGGDDPVRPFVLRLTELAKTANDYALVAGFAESLGRPDLSVLVARRAGYAGVPLLVHGYPLIPIPAEGVAERALVLAMTRQESGFDQEAVSGSGARGLMQLMPTTAKHAARALSVRYSAKRLVQDPIYNLKLGRAYLNELLEDFDGSYVLAVAAYNAGPGRVRQWLEVFGDPRTKKIDVVDWVESLPFSETRNYVQRVLESLQVYRLRLGDEDLAFTLPDDLKR
jgi:soluble lytic murein transglycosylase